MPAGGKLAAEEQLGLDFVGAILEHDVFEVDGGIAGKFSPVGEGPADFDLLAEEHVAGVAILVGAEIEIELEAMGEAQFQLIEGAGFGGAILVDGGTEPVFEFNLAFGDDVDAGAGETAGGGPARLGVGADAVFFSQIRLFFGDDGDGREFEGAEALLSRLRLGGGTLLGVGGVDDLHEQWGDVERIVSGESGGGE